MFCLSLYLWKLYSNPDWFLWRKCNNPPLSWCPSFQIDFFSTKSYKFKAIHYDEYIPNTFIFLDKNKDIHLFKFAKTPHPTTAGFLFKTLAVIFFKDNEFFSKKKWMNDLSSLASQKSILRFPIFSKSNCSLDPFIANQAPNDFWEKVLFYIQIIICILEEERIRLSRFAHDPVDRPHVCIYCWKCNRKKKDTIEIKWKMKRNHLSSILGWNFFCTGSKQIFFNSSLSLLIFLSI